MLLPQAVIVRKGNSLSSLVRVNMLTTSAGPKGVWPAGSVCHLPQGEAENLVRGGFAKYLDNPPPEKATIEPQERAVLPRPKGKKR